VQEAAVLLLEKENLVQAEHYRKEHSVSKLAYFSNILTH
jgi:hypothetical protein